MSVVCIYHFQLYFWNVRCSFWMHYTLCRHGTVCWSRGREIQQLIRAWRCLYVLRFCEFNVLTVILFPEHIEFVFILGECKRPNHSDLHFGGICLCCNETNEEEESPKKSIIIVSILNDIYPIFKRNSKNRIKFQFYIWKIYVKQLSFQN